MSPHPCAWGLAIALTLPGRVLAAPGDETQPALNVEPAVRDDSTASLDVLRQRAEVRMVAGDYDTAIDLLAAALEAAIAEQAPLRSRAEIRLALVDAHQRLSAAGRPGHATVADQLRRDLLDERVALRLSPQEVRELQAALEPPPAEAPAPEARPEQSPPPPSGGGDGGVFEEKILESQILTDRKLISGGSTLASVGLGFGIAGGVLLIYAAAAEQRLSQYRIPDQETERRNTIRDGTRQNSAGITFVALGGTFFVAGLTMLSVGSARRRKRIRNKEKEAKVKPTAGLGWIGGRF